MAGAVPRLGSERGLLLTHERPPGDVAFLHPSLAVGGVRAEAAGRAAHQLDPVRAPTQSAAWSHTPVPAALLPLQGTSRHGRAGDQRLEAGGRLVLSGHPSLAS